jgi:hypothetical protein
LVSFVLGTIAWGFLVASSRGSVKIDRDLSRKRIGPLALARLYGESWIWYSLGIVCIKTMRAILLAEKYLSPNLWKKVSFAKSLEGRILR